MSLMRTRRHIVVEIAYALIGETRLGVLGATLQWLSLLIASVAATFGLSLPPFALSAMLFFSICTLFGGIVFALRGRSLGPIIAIPGFIGVCLLGALTVLLYPLRFLTKEESPK